jgi:hypothetical protein
LAAHDCLPHTQRPAPMSNGHAARASSTSVMAACDQPGAGASVYTSSATKRIVDAISTRVSVPAAARTCVWRARVRCGECGKEEKNQNMIVSSWRLNQPAGIRPIHDRWELRFKQECYAHKTDRSSSNPPLIITIRKCTHWPTHPLIHPLHPPTC